MADPEVPRQRQNFLGGFKLTLEHLGRPPVTRQYPEEKRPKQPRQHGRHVLNRYEDGMEKCIGCELCAGVCPADCIYVRGLDNPPDHPVSPGRALRLRLRDQLPAVHPLRPVRRGLPHRGHHRVEADGVLLHQPERRHLHQGRAAGRRRRQAPGTCPGRTGGRATTCTPRAGCGPPHRRERPTSRARCSGRASSGFGVRSPEGGPVGRPRRRHAPAAGSSATPSSATSSRSTCPADKRGPRGAIGRMLEKAERFAPGAGKKHRDRADAEYAAAVRAGNTQRDEPASGDPGTGGRRPPNRTRPDGSRARSGARRGDRLRPRVLGRRGHLRGGRRHHPVRGGRRGGGPQSGPLGAHAGHDPVRRGRAVRAAARPVPGRGAGHRVRRRHRGAVPVRHHVPRGRPRGEHRPRAPAAASGRWPSG